jgi:hypothetical protein
LLVLGSARGAKIIEANLNIEITLAIPDKVALSFTFVPIIFQLTEAFFRLEAARSNAKAGIWELSCA